MALYLALHLLPLSGGSLALRAREACWHLGQVLGPFGCGLQPPSMFGLQWPRSLPLWTAQGGKIMNSVNAGAGVYVCIGVWTHTGNDYKNIFSIFGEAQPLSQASLNTMVYIPTYNSIKSQKTKWRKLQKNNKNKEAMTTLAIINLYRLVKVNLLLPVKGHDMQILYTDIRLSYIDYHIYYILISDYQPRWLKW